MPMTQINKMIFPELSYKICGFCFYVHNRFGNYRNEKQYADAFEKVLQDNGIKYEREKKLPPSFAGEAKNRNIADFIIEDKIIVDFKAKPIITKDDYFQTRRYSVSFNKKLGLIINFHQKYLRPKRILNSQI